MPEMRNEALHDAAVPCEYDTVAFTYPCPGCGCENVHPYRRRPDQTVRVICLACGWTQRAIFLKVRPAGLSAPVHEGVHAEVAGEEEG